MKLIKITCPNCGSNLEIDKEKGYDMCYCTYCGTKLLIDSENRVNLNIYRDEAEILRLNLEEKRRLEQIAIEDEYYNLRTKVVIFSIIAIASFPALLFLIYLIPFEFVWVLLCIAEYVLIFFYGRCCIRYRRHYERYIKKKKRK